MIEKMEILNQEWLISLFSVTTGSLLIILANQLKEKSRRKSEIKLEKLKTYDEKKFQAYLELYEFISRAYSMYYPPDNVRQDFIYIMKKFFFAKVKVNYPYFKKEIREKIKILENQYDCLREPDFIPDIPIEKFIQSEYLKILNELNQTIEKIFDEWEKV